MKVFAPRGVEIYARREMRGLIDNQRKRLEENSARSRASRENDGHDSNLIMLRETVDFRDVRSARTWQLNKFLVVKLLRAHEGCLGIGGRRRTR